MKMNIKNSLINKTIYTYINKEGILEYVKEIEKAIIMNEEYEYGEEQEENMEEMGNNDYRNEEMENYDKNDLEINDLDI